MSSFVTAAAEADLEEVSSEAQPFGPLTALNNREVGLKEMLFAAEARALDAEREKDRAVAALAAAMAEGQGRQDSEAKAALEETLQALQQAQADLARYREIADKAQAEGNLSEFRYIDPSKITDALPSDRFDVAYSEQELASLMADIRDRQQDNPILVRPTPNAPEGEAFEIAAGKRRLAACRELGIPVLARVRPLSDREMLQARFGENHHRQDLSAFERARYYEHSMNALGLNAVELAELFGIGRTVIQHHLSLNRIPSRVVNAFRKPHAVSQRSARRLLDILERDQTAEDRIVTALQKLGTDAKRGVAAAQEQEEIEVAIAAGIKREPAAPRRNGDGNLPVYVGRRKIATARLASGRWQLRFDDQVDEEFMEILTNRLPDILEEISRERGRVKANQDA